MDVVALRRRCAAIVDALELPNPFDIPALCEILERERGRPITLVPVALPPKAPCGLWISDDDRDYIVYEKATSPLHQDHIILHEIGHLLCDHPDQPGLHEEHSRQLFPDLDPALVRRVLGRASYNSEQEAEAEMLASLIFHRADHTPLPPPEPNPAIAEIVRRLESGL